MLLVRQARDQTVVVVSCFVTLFLRAGRRGLGSCHNFPNPEDQFFVRMGVSSDTGQTSARETGQQQERSRATSSPSLVPVRKSGVWPTPRDFSIRRFRSGRIVCRCCNQPFLLWPLADSFLTESVPNNGRVEVVGQRAGRGRLISSE